MRRGSRVQVHRKTQMSHLTYLSHSGSLHGQKDSFFTYFWVILSVYWPTVAQMSQMTHLGFSVWIDLYAGNYKYRVPCKKITKSCSVRNRLKLGWTFFFFFFFFFFFWQGHLLRGDCTWIPKLSMLCAISKLYTLYEANCLKNSKWH